ncbi:MAG: type III pantothenate kinase [Planctomycetota bacterium]
MDTDIALTGVDIGNTRTKLAVISPDDVLPAFHAPTRPVATLAARLESCMNSSGPVLPEQSRCLICSVHPEATGAVTQFCRAHMKCAPEVLRKAGQIPLPIDLEEADRVGTDRLLCALGARSLMGPPCIIISAGTAIVVDLISDTGAFAGGAIAPGFALSSRALHQETGELPEVGLKPPAGLPGRNTEEAIRNGIWHFCTAGTERLTRRLAAACSTSPDVVITGGDADKLLRIDLPFPVHHQPHLLFIGMREMARSNGNA